LTTQESLQYVKDKLGSEIGPDNFNHVRAELKRDVKKNLSYLQKDRFAYVREFFDRIDEVRYIQKRLWKIIENNPDKPILQKSCLSELHQSTLTLCNLYDALPAAIAVRPDFVNGGYDSTKHDNLSHSTKTR
jgi:arylsulfatase A-like enzyme